MSYLAALRLLGILIQVLILRFVGNALSGRELATFLLGIALLAWSSRLGTAGFLPPLLRRMAQDGEPLALGEAIGPAMKRAAWAGLFYLLIAIVCDTAVLPALALAILHLLLPFHLAAAHELLHGRTRLLAGCEILARLLCLAAFALLSLTGTETAWPWLLCWWLGALTPSLLLWRSLQPDDRRLFRLRMPKSLSGSRPALPPRTAETIVAVGDFVRSAWFEGIHPIVRALVGSTGYLGFGAAFSLHRVGTTLPSALATAVQGPLSRGASNDKRSLLLRILPGWLAIGVLAAVAGMLLAPTLLGFLFPNLSATSRDEALASIRVLMASWPALFGAGLCLPFLLARGRERQVAILSAAALLLCFGTLFLGLPSLGSMAASWSLLATECFVFLGSFVLVLTPSKDAAAPLSRSLS